MYNSSLKKTNVNNYWQELHDRTQTNVLEVAKNMNKKNHEIKDIERSRTGTDCKTDDKIIVKGCNGHAHTEVMVP